MAKRKRHGRHQQRAFTLIEVILVIMVLSLMVAAVVPRLVAIKQSRDQLDLEASVARLPVMARNIAAQTGQPVTLQISNDSLVMQQSQTDGTTSQVKEVSFNSLLSVGNAQLNGRTVDPSVWTWTAYPDGTTDSGGLEFTEGKAQKTLVLLKDRNVRWIDGALPDTTGDEWTAGELLPRS